MASTGAIRWVAAATCFVVAIPLPVLLVMRRTMPLAAKYSFRLGDRYEDQDVPPAGSFHEESYSSAYTWVSSTSSTVDIRLNVQ